MSARGAPSGAIRRWRRFAQVVGVRLHYVERGSGTPLVMRHGVGSMATELMLSPLFSFAAARYRVIAVDRPGYGYSTRPRGRLWTPQAQATLVRQLLVQLGVERPVVFGHGYGALVALSLALAYPTALRGLVLAAGYFFPTKRLDLPRAGHMVHHTDPRRVFQAIEAAARQV